MLGRLLGVEAKRGLASRIELGIDRSIGRDAAGGGAGNRLEHDASPLTGWDAVHLHTGFGRRAEEREPFAPNIEHVGTRVRGAEPSIGGERIGAGKTEAARRDDLKDVAGDNVLLEALDDAGEAFVIETAFDGAHVIS